MRPRSIDIFVDSLSKIYCCHHFGRFRSLLVVGGEQIIFTRGVAMAGDAAHFRALGHTPGKLHALGVFVQGSVGQIFGPEPILIVGIVTGFTLEHNRHRAQRFGAVGLHRFDFNAGGAIIVLYD